MRIRRRVAVPREMFRRRKSPVSLHTQNKRRNVLRNARRIFSKRSRIDDRIVRIVVHVRVGRVNPLDANGARFQRGDLSHRVRVLHVSARRKRHRRRKRSPFIEPHRCAALEIGRDQQRQFRFRLQLVRQHRGWIRLALHDSQRRSVRHVDEAAHVQFFDVVHHLLICGRVRRGEAPVIGSEKNLPDLFFGRHFAQRRFHPLICRGRKFPWIFAERRGLFRGSRTLLGGSSVLTAHRVGHKKNDNGERNENQSAGTASFPQLVIPRLASGC